MSCPICDKPLAPRRKYCSRPCQDKAKAAATINHHNYRETPVKYCLACGTEIPRRLYQSPSVYKRRDYCSHQCSGTAHKTRCECGAIATHKARYNFLHADLNRIAISTIPLCAKCYALMMETDPNARQCTEAYLATNQREGIAATSEGQSRHNHSRNGSHAQGQD